MKFKTISPKAPTVHEFCRNLATTCGRIVNEMNLPKKHVKDIVAFILDGLNKTAKTFTQKEVDTIAQMFLDDIPRGFSPSKDVINYELMSLGFVMSYAIETKDSYLKSKVNDIKKDRGYIYHTPHALSRERHK